MKQDPIWRAFALTGDPLYYLLYRVVTEQEAADSGISQAGSHPASVSS